MTKQKRQVAVRRVYEDPVPAEGRRVLVDRFWPRGLSKDKARVDEWCKQIAPSTALRRWYGHEPARFAEFTRRYVTELGDAEQADALEHLRELADHGSLTLLTATKDSNISQASVLAELIRKRSRTGDG